MDLAWSSLFFSSNMSSGLKPLLHEVHESEKGYFNLTLGAYPALRQFLILAALHSPGELKQQNPMLGLYLRRGDQNWVEGLIPPLLSSPGDLKVQLEVNCL